MARQGGDSVEVVERRSDVAVIMGDGTRLSADVFLPTGGGRYPVLLCRTIYDKDDPRYVDWALRWAQSGYGVVIQDCRGRYDSAGVWRPYVDEASDGCDTLAWIAGHPWCDGKIGMFGLSYVGFTQLQAALGADEHLRCIVPMACQEDNYGFLWCEAVPQLQNFLAFLGIGGRVSQTPPSSVADQARATLPLKALDQFDDIPVYREWLAHPTLDDYWLRYSLKGRYDQIKVPAHFVTGWYDNLLHEQFKCFAGLRQHGGTPAARDLTRITVGPWPHGYGKGGSFAKRVVGDIDFGPAAEIDLYALQSRWFERHLQGREAGGEAQEAPINIFVMGDNAWRSEREWPLARTQFTRFYLHSAGHANTARGDGMLSVQPPRTEPVDQFIYDPRNPVPTVGGQIMAGSISGPRDRRALEERPDILIYTTEPFDQATEVTGPVFASLSARSSAVDTDFTATVADVLPDGRVLPVCEGIVRARYRESLTQPSVVDPGTAYEFRISLWETSYVFAPGHCLRLEVSCSNFPRFARNLNTGQPVAEEAEPMVARQQILHDGDHPSHLLLPVIPR